uniref:TSA: Wollemia nobilis Ref_Wollemi_Transcript_2586_1194 transcribed RNA sequence n=1 Tax=Wollemia nobilis TaxID=56998 RepID=A0A0C9SAK4_9CONI
MLGTGSGSSLNFMQSWAEEIKKGRQRRKGPGNKASCSARGFLKMRARSVSPPRTPPVSYDWEEFSRLYDEEEETSGAAGVKKRRDSWGSCLREFLYRSISEGRGSAREKERESVVFATPLAAAAAFSSPVRSEKKNAAASKRGEAASNGRGWLGKKKSAATPPGTPNNNNKAGRKGHVVSAHERYYPVERARAQAEEMKRKTFLPYKQAVLGCLGPSFAHQQNPSVLLSPSAI